MKLQPKQFLIVATVLALVMAACGSDDSASETTAATTATTTGNTPTTEATEPVPGVTDDSITIALIALASGPWAEAILDGAEGMHIWAADVNARGGIYGRQVKLKTFDHGETADGAVAACQAVLADPDVYLPVNSQGQTAHLISANCMDERGRTNLVWEGSREFVQTWEHTYSIYPTPERVGEILAHFVQSKTEPGEPIGLIQLTTEIEKLSGDAFQAEAIKIGLNIVGIENVEFDATTFVPQLTRLQEAGATTVVPITVGQEGAAIQEAATIGFEPAWVGVHYVWDFLPQGSPGLYTGVEGLAFGQRTETGAWEGFLALADKYSDRENRNAATMLSYGQGLIFEQILLGAGPDPTLESLEAAIQTITNFETGIISPVTWTADQSVGSDGMWPAICCNDDNTWKSNGEAFVPEG